MEYVFPAIIRANGDGSFTVTFPDLPGCITEGKSLANAVSMAQKALTQWLGYLNDKGEAIPAASDGSTFCISAEEQVNLICAEPKKEYAVRRSVSLPKWLDDQAAAAGLNYSRVFQEALKKELLSFDILPGFSREECQHRR